jgi:hypothetical protein
MVAGWGRESEVEREFFGGGGWGRGGESVKSREKS